MRFSSGMLENRKCPSKRPPKTRGVITQNLHKTSAKCVRETQLSIKYFTLMRLYMATLLQIATRVKLLPLEKSQSIHHVRRSEKINLTDDGVTMLLHEAEQSKTRSICHLCEFPCDELTSSRSDFRGALTHFPSCTKTPICRSLVLQIIF